MGWMSLLAAGADPHPLCDASFFFHQLLAGVDVAVPSRASTPSQRRVFDMAKQMQNYMYLVGDAQTRECVAVDAVYDPAGVMAAADAHLVQHRPSNCCSNSGQWRGGHITYPSN